MVLTLGLTVVSTLVPGRTTTCTVTVSTPGRTVVATRVSTRWTRNTDLEYTNGLMVDAMRVTGSMGNSMGRESIYYRMELLRSESGKMERGLSGSMSMIMKTKRKCEQENKDL